MNVWATIFLGVIAVATLGTVVMQIYFVWQASQIARRATAVLNQVEQDLKPFIANATAVSEDAARISALALTQAERADQAVGDVVERLSDTVTLVQRGLIGPAREGLAIIAALRGMVRAFRGSSSRRRSSSGTDEEEALFI